MSPRGEHLLAYDVVDVFADGPFAGNQLAVVHGTDGLSGEQLQAIASEFGYSETTFPTSPGDGRYEVRIFTPGQELPFAGHPTLGTAWVLRDRELLAGDDVVQRCGAGDVPVRFVGDLVELTGTPDEPEGPLDRALVDRLLAAVGLAGDDLAGEAWIAGTGLPWLHLPVHTGSLARAHLPGVTFDEVVGADWSGTSAAGAALVELDPPGGNGVHPARSRVFAMDGDGFEDPATGSAAASLGVALVARGVLGDGGRVEIAQGVEMGRPSRLHVSVSVVDGAATAVRVVGQVHPVARGEIRIPPA